MRLSIPSTIEAVTGSPVAGDGLHISFGTAPLTVTLEYPSSVSFAATWRAASRNISAETVGKSARGVASGSPPK